MESEENEFISNSFWQMLIDNLNKQEVRQLMVALKNRYEALTESDNSANNEQDNEQGNDNDQQSNQQQSDNQQGNISADNQDLKADENAEILTEVLDKNDLDDVLESLNYLLGISSKKKYTKDIYGNKLVNESVELPNNPEQYESEMVKEARDFWRASGVPTDGIEENVKGLQYYEDNNDNLSDIFDIQIDHDDDGQRETLLDGSTFSHNTTITCNPAKMVNVKTATGQEVSIPANNKVSEMFEDDFTPDDIADITLT